MNEEGAVTSMSEKNAEKVNKPKAINELQTSFQYCAKTIQIKAATYYFRINNNHSNRFLTEAKKCPLTLKDLPLLAHSL